VIRHTQKFIINNFNLLRLQLLNWASQFSSCSFLDNNQYQSTYNQQECLVAVGAKKMLQCSAGNALQQLQLFIDANTGQWIFGHLAYDLKNEIEHLEAKKTNPIAFDDLCFFVPNIVVALTQTQLVIHSFANDHQAIFDAINNTSTKPLAAKNSSAIKMKARLTKQAYINKINKLKNNIQRGDCYEINFCQEYYAQNKVINTTDTYEQLSAISPNPFSCYYKINNSHLICSSPERYLQKKGDTIISQPIKGTAARNFDNSQADEQLKTKLKTSTKERSENVMVVDLVRNDLSKICLQGSVEIAELFGIYTYPQVHQMISTITGQLATNTSFTKIIAATFPMGSMTGAPKKRVMQLIDETETSSRGLFSGAIGYIAPNGDFDFNVVIRSIFYNQTTQYISYWVGSGITYYCNAEQEYKECQLKAKAIKKVLS
jgi:para-aminobenzoate synthetase component I